MSLRDYTVLKVWENKGCDIFYYAILFSQIILSTQIITKTYVEQRLRFFSVKTKILFP